MKKSYLRALKKAFSETGTLGPGYSRAMRESKCAFCPELLRAMGYRVEGELHCRLVREAWPEMGIRARWTTNGYITDAPTSALRRAKL